MTVTISKDFTFEASHVLPLHPGKCSRLHGHSWHMTVAVRGPVNERTGFVCDYGTLKELVAKHVVDYLDHSHLGYGPAVTSYGASERVAHPLFGPEFYPSSENLVVAVARVLGPLIKELASDVRLVEVCIRETCTAAARWAARD